MLGCLLTALGLLVLGTAVFGAFGVLASALGGIWAALFVLTVVVFAGALAVRIHDRRRAGSTTE